MGKMSKAEYFYTVSTPHAWTSGGPVIRTRNEEGQPIASLAEAQALAKKHEHLSGTEGRVEVTWGARVTYAENVDYHGNPRDELSDWRKSDGWRLVDERVGD